MEGTPKKQVSPRQRVLIHIPVGIGNVAVCWASPITGGLLGASFMLYELMQSLSVSWDDRGYYDVLGYVIGLGIGGGIWALLKILGMCSIIGAM